MNCYRMTRDGSLDREYLRTSAIYRLLKRRKIDRARAIELQSHRYANGKGSPRDGYLTKTIDMWLSGPLSERERAANAAWCERD